MKKGIVLHSIVPLRTEPNEEAEQATQLLFGETCTIREEFPQWNRVELDLDGQQGWVDAKMVSEMSNAEYQVYRKQYRRSTALVKYPIAFAVSANNGQTIPLTAGTRLPEYRDGSFSLLGVAFRIDPTMVCQQPLEMNQSNLLQLSRFFLNVPYLWGGKNAMGMDCSGFTQVLLSLFGKSLKRNASEQAQQGRQIAQLCSAKAGDLAFFDHEDGRISHVGILIDSERIIHCSGRVKVEKIDKKGIWSAERADQTHPQGQYTHHLVSIRRL